MSICGAVLAHLRMSLSLRVLLFPDSAEVITAAELPKGDLCLTASEGGKTHKSHFIHIAEMLLSDTRE